MTVSYLPAWTPPSAQTAPSPDGRSHRWLAWSRQQPLTLRAKAPASSLPCRCSHPFRTHDANHWGPVAHTGGYWNTPASTAHSSKQPKPPSPAPARSAGTLLWANTAPSRKAPLHSEHVTSSVLNGALLTACLRYFRPGPTRPQM